MAWSCTNLTRQWSDEGGEKKREQKHRAERKICQRKRNARNCSSGWMPTQKPPKKKKKKEYRAPETFLTKKTVPADVCQVVLVLAVPAPPLSPRRSQPEILLWRGDPRHPITLASYPLGNMHPLKHLCISESVWKASRYWALALLIAYTIPKIINPVRLSHMWYITVWSISLIILELFFPVDLQIISINLKTFTSQQTQHNRHKLGPDK